jgi:hypothetical protein
MSKEIITERTSLHADLSRIFYDVSLDGILSIYVGIFRVGVTRNKDIPYFSVRKFGEDSILLNPSYVQKQQKGPDKQWKKTFVDGFPGYAQLDLKYVDGQYYQLVKGQPPFPTGITNHLCVSLGLMVGNIYGGYIWSEDVYTWDVRSVGIGEMIVGDDFVSRNIMDSLVSNDTDTVSLSTLQNLGFNQITKLSVLGNRGENKKI